MTKRKGIIILLLLSLILISAYSVINTYKGQEETELVVKPVDKGDNDSVKQADHIVSKVPEKLSGQGVYNTDFELFLEAETAELSGNVREADKKKGYTGEGYLMGFEEEGDGAAFHIIVPGDGAYDLEFTLASFDGYKENTVLIDNIPIGNIIAESDKYQVSGLKQVYLEEGEHTIRVLKYWGWIYLDSLKVTASKPINQEIYQVSAELSDKKANKETKSLMKYLVDNYGKCIISGQYGDGGINGKEFQAIYKETGKYPAMMGLDFIEYSPSGVLHGSVGKDVEYAIEFYQAGGIITFCWHWNPPEKYLYNTTDIPWWKGFYTEGSKIDLTAIRNGQDTEGYNLLLKDMDAIAEQLKRLEKEQIPVLFRPLHEASGGWFWWGAFGADTYKWLYQLLYDRLVQYHDIHNLIWVWNGQNKEWYPGDKYVDIAGFDIYPGEKVYHSQASKFQEISEWDLGSKKIIAMTENGCMFDPDLAFRDSSLWSYFGTWEGEFLIQNNTETLSEKYTETKILKKVYLHEKVLTLDELPDLSHYGH